MDPSKHVGSAKYRSLVYRSFNIERNINNGKQEDNKNRVTRSAKISSAFRAKHIRLIPGEKKLYNI